MNTLQNFLKKSSPSAEFNKLSLIVHDLVRGEGRVNSNIEKISYPTEYAVSAISGSKKWYFSSDNSSHGLTYSFKKEPGPDGINKFHTNDFHEIPDVNKADVRESLKSWSDIANINFIEVSDSADSNIRFSGYDASKEAGEQGQTFTRSIFGSIISSEIFLNVSDFDRGLYLGGYNRLTIVHEIGHALGLDHPSKYDASDSSLINYSNSAGYREDTVGYSVMSYWDELNSNQQFRTDDDFYNGVRYYPHAPQIDDIASVAYLYGPNFSTRTDDTVYGYNSNAGSDYTIQPGSKLPPIFSIWDAGGNDTLDFSGYDGTQIISLTPGTQSSTNGYVGNISIAEGVTIENAIGGSGNDLIMGDLSLQPSMDGSLNTHNEIHAGAGDDLIFGGITSDNLWGGEGNNTFLYSAVNESSSTDPDIIFDFKSGADKIDLSGMDELLDIDGLHFVTEFHGVKGEAYIADYEKAGVNILNIDFSGAGEPDFSIIAVGQITPQDITV